MQYSLNFSLTGEHFLLGQLKIKVQIFLSLSAVLWLPLAVFAKDQEPSVPQLKLCWQFADFESTLIPPATQNEHLFVTASGGKMFALNLTNGETMWRTELGGEIIGSSPPGENLIYAASQISATKDKSAFIIIRALSLETGLTVWQGEFPAASQIALALQDKYLLVATDEVGSETGKVFALAAESGELMWTQKQTARLTTSLAVVNDSLIFATADKTLHILKIADGIETRRFLLPHPAQEKIASKNNTLIFGDRAGNVSALRQTDGKNLWTVRLGAAAQSILPTRDGVVISSLDDFVYFHNASNGKRIWRKRLASRPLGAALLSNDAVLLVASGENTSSLFSLKKGKILNQFFLGEDNVAVAAPFAANGFVIVPTNQGLKSFAPFSDVCPVK